MTPEGMVEPLPEGGVRGRSSGRAEQLEVIHPTGRRRREDSHRIVDNILITPLSPGYSPVRNERGGLRRTRGKGALIKLMASNLLCSRGEEMPVLLAFFSQKHNPKGVNLF